MTRSIYFSSIAVCFALFPLLFPSTASAFDSRLSPWAGRCAQGGCGGGGGGGYVAPAPSPAEIAAAQASAVNNDGLNAENEGNWTLAASLYEQALRINPDDPVIANNLKMARAHLLNDAGIEADNAENSDLAASLYEQALRLSPNDAVIANNLRMARAAVERVTLQRKAEQSAADEKRNAARELIASHILANADAKRNAALELINGYAVARAEAKRNTASEQINKAQRAPTVSPSMFITEAEYKSAQNNLARLQKQRDGLTRQLAKAKEWAAGLRKDDNEFEQMRQEARKDLAWEFLDHLPVSEGLDVLARNPALKNVNVEQIKTAYEAVKGLLETGRGISAKDDREKIENVLAGNRALQAAGVRMLALDDKSRKLYDAASKIVTYGATLAANAGTSDGSNRDNLKAVMTLVEILQPLAGAGVLLEGGIERGGQWYYAGKALNSLREAESNDWNAQRYLTQKIEQLNIQVEEINLTVKKHDMASGQDNH